MAVALVDHRLTEDLARPRAVVKLHRVGTQAHRPAHVGDLLLLRQQVDDREGRLGVELGRVGPFHPGDVTGELGDRDLHPEADAEIRDALHARDPRRLDLPLDPALPKPPGMRIPSAQSAIRAGSNSSESTNSTSTFVP